MAEEHTSKGQLTLISKIENVTGIISPKCVQRAKPLAQSWIALVSASITEKELADVKVTPNPYDKTQHDRHIARLSTAIGGPTPANHEKETIRNWLKLLADVARVPESDKILRFWQRALLYRDLNAFADDKVPGITAKPVPGKLPEFLPKLSESFEAPKIGKSGDAIALLIAYIPKVGKLRASALLGVPLAYDETTHSLVPPPEGAVPFFNREWLEPPDPDATKNAYFGSVLDCDDYFSNNPPPSGAAWPDYWCYVEQFVRAITGVPNPLPHLAPLVLRRDTAWKIVAWDAGGASRKIAETYQRAITGEAPPLLTRLCEKPLAPGMFAPANALQKSNALLGHIDTFDPKRAGRVGFGLERSQRIAATAMTQVPDGQLLTVNGPPGTGKTSFLRAVIGTEYVQAAIKGGDPTLILATAATNKAVTNIIESFAGIAGPEMQPEWASRWLPNLPSYGWFFPAGSRKDDELDGFMVLAKDWGKDGEPPRIVMRMAASDFFASQQQKRLWMVDAFLDLHRQTLGLPTHARDTAHAAEMIRDQLVRSVERMRTLQTAFRNCMEMPAKHECFRRSETEWQALLYSHGEQVERHQADLVQTREALRQWNECLVQLREATRLRKKCTGLFYRISRLFLGDRLGAQAQFLENTALKRMAILDLAYSAYREDCLEVAERKQARTSRFATDIEEQLRVAREQTESARAMITQWAAWHAEVTRISDQLGVSGKELAQQVATWTQSSFPIDHDLELRFEEALDQSFRFLHFHMAARYWEARWLADVPTPKDVGDTLLSLRRAAMLAPAIVATVYTLPGIERQFQFADLLIFDESGQASPEIGAASFAYARRAIVVGDIYQLKPVWNVGKEADARLRADIGIDDMPEALSASAGSIMKVAQAHTTLTMDGAGKLGHGIDLTAHYRCRADIIEYCCRLIYGECLSPVRVERPPNGQPAFLYPPMAWVAVTQKESAQKQDGSWINRDQIHEIVRWLLHDTPRILAHYGVSHISEVVALIAPFRAQAHALRKAVAACLGPDEARAMVINTVHALQGAEKPIVAFTLTQDEGNFFVDRDGPNLLNVAVSRAKDCFILFASPSVIQPQMDGKAAYATRQRKEQTPLSLLVEYMNEKGRRLYPREVVVIEAPGKEIRVAEALGLSAQVVPTGGHFRRLVVKNNGLHPEITNNDTESALKNVTQDLRQIDTFYLATDDDDDGEEIAWHVQEVLRSQGVDDPTRIRRMRFYSLTPEDIRQSRELALPGIDAHRVRGNVLRSLFDAALHRQLAQTGIQSSRPQLALLREIAQRAEEPGSWRLEVAGNVGGKKITAYVLDDKATGPAEYPDAEEAAAVAATLPNCSTVGFASPVNSVTLPRYPAATTAQTMVAAYRRYQWSPARTMDALKALYLGHTTPQAYGVGVEPDDEEFTGDDL